MQELINQAEYISDFLQGDGNPTYGPVPLVPASEFISPQQTHNPYPYSPAAAITVLRRHGWQVTPHGTDSCTHPGPGTSQCGAGITAGARLSFSLQYANSVTGVTEETDALQSAFAQAGIKLAVSGAPFSTVVGDYLPCAHAGCWQMNYYGQGWYFNPGYNDPDGSILFQTHGAFMSRPGSRRAPSNTKEKAPMATVSRQQNFRTGTSASGTASHPTGQFSGSRQTNGTPSPPGYATENSTTSPRPDNANPAQRK
jgi:ABC-type transport system substrate-binding protein